MVSCHNALAEAGLTTKTHPPDPRRAALRGPAGGDGAGDGDRHARDGRRGRHGPAADGRRRRRRQLAERQVSRGQNVALVVALVIGAVVAAPGPAELAARRAAIGGLPATTIALGVSFVSLLLLTADRRASWAASATSASAPLYVIVGGGLVGALYVGSIVWTVRALGVGGLSAAHARRASSPRRCAIDHFGWLGRRRARRSPRRASSRGVGAAGRGDVPDRAPTNLQPQDPEEARR